MIKATVLLVIAVAWLFADRHSLNDQMSSLQNKMETVRRQKVDLEIKLAKLVAQEQRPTSTAISTPVVQKTWLQERIEKSYSQSTLETADRRHVAPTNPNISAGSGAYSVRRGSSGELYPRTTVVNNQTNNTVNIVGGARPTPEPQRRYIQRPVGR